VLQDKPSCRPRHLVRLNIPGQDVPVAFDVLSPQAMVELLQGHQAALASGA
jgi:hypothetical protein